MTEETERKITKRWGAQVRVRRDGRVIVASSYHHGGPPLLLGRVRRLETHDGPAWFWSRDEFQDDVNVGGLTRRDAVEGLLQHLAAEAK